MTGWILRGFALSIALSIAAVPGVVLAQQSKIAAGRQAAQGLCARCHLIAPTNSASWTDAPPFSVIADRPGVTEAKLTEIIMKPHMDMINAPHTTAQADDIAAYIMSLKQK